MTEQLDRHMAAWDRGYDAGRATAERQLATVTAERNEAVTLLRELADELEAEVNNRYFIPPDYTEPHPAMKRRYDSDIEPVERTRSFLAKYA